ncbi:sacsin-like [Amphiura filiformis]|uniref:sacsin-like n=1 Tax=Amphiura filiformis TaxID=82378 RepID=UPI003B222819
MADNMNDSENAECSSSEDESFGQRTPPLTVYLQRILDKYPDGGQILKELVQNADDAGARRVIFMFDQTQYATDSLCSQELSKFQGPALYAYNDGVFNDKDWHNIQNPEQSGKKNEPTKTGRFGLGFNSVYHVTVSFKRNFSQAFDCVSREKLMAKLISVGIRGKMKNILTGLNKTVKACIRKGNTISEFLTCTTGLKQGCLLSPLQFALFISELSNFLDNNGAHGFQLYPDITEINSLYYADDIVIMADTVGGLKKHIASLQEFCLNWEMKVNINKTQIMIFRKGGRIRRDEAWFYQNNRHDVVKSYRYLGIQLSTGNAWGRATRALADQANIPSILSGPQLGYLDPQEKCFGEGNKGKSWRLNSNRLLQSPDQLKPFMHHIFDIDDETMRKGHYPGTIFRFPLRQEESELSKTIYTNKRVEDLFASYQEDAEISLLYLKSVESVSLYMKQSDSEDPQLLYRVCIAENDINNVREKRRMFVEGCKAMTEDVETCMDFHIEKSTSFESKSSRYVTLNLLKIQSVSKELQDHDLKLLPWVSVTIPANDIISSTDLSAGRVFCFLPLPADESPGFPVHIHGYFGLNDNRRGIKWPDGDSAKDPQAQWNRKLIQEVFPHAYGRLLLQAIASDMTPGDVYRCWPGAGENRHQIWNEGVVALVIKLQQERILFSEVDGGRWLTPQEVLLNEEADTTLSDLIQKVLLQKRQPVVKIPSNVQYALDSAAVEITTVSPALVRNAIRDDTLNWLSDEEKLMLLKYIIRDEEVRDICNIHLLTLRDGSFRQFSKLLDDVYIPSHDMPSDIIPNLDHRFAAETLPPSLHTEDALGVTQLVEFNVEHVLTLLKEALPRHWVQTADLSVQWHHIDNGHPQLQWLSNIWTWLSHNHRKLPMDHLKDIPLLPVQSSSEETSQKLVKLQPNKIIFKSGHAPSDIESSSSDLNIPDCICSFLENLGVIVINHHLPDFVTDHPETAALIQPATPDGVCNILMASNKQLVIKATKEMTKDVKDTFRIFLADLPIRCIEKHHDFLTQLPVFPDTRGSYVSVVHCKRMISEDYHGVPVTHLKDAFICIKDESSEEFLKKLGCHKVLEEELLKSYILPHVSYPDSYYKDAEMLELMAWILERSQYDSDIKSVRFIPTGDGSKESPYKLFDPDIDDLKRLFCQSSLFPVGDFAEGELLKQIRRVGFRDPCSITAPELLTAASEIQRCVVTIEVLSRARILFAHINKMTHLLNDQVRYDNITKPLASFLQEKPWVPVMLSPSHIIEYPSSLTWFGHEPALFKPRDVAAYSTVLLQGSVVPIVDQTGLSESMASTFDWHRELDPHNFEDVRRVVQHLKNLCNSYHDDSDTATYTKMTSTIYHFLNQSSTDHVNSAIDTELEDVPWVWHGQGFTSTDKVAFDGGSLRVKLDPYLFILPKSAKVYDRLLSGAGVKENFPDNVLCSVLVSIQKENQDNKKSEKQIQDDLGLVCDILNCISNSQTEGNQLTQDILVPIRNKDTSLELVEAHNCLYVDDERLLDQYDNSECELPVVHPKLPTETAKHLGLLRLSHYVAPTEAIDLGYDMEGPHETTVDAIRRNLDLYKEGVDIFKELIQNADDAGASEVKFLIDWRTNTMNKTTLLNNDMQSCHGPALWAYNDAQFSESDVKNICNIAAATKKLELEKVGRFGIGFTSVYHLTDVPSVVSGPFIMIFDPRTTHLRERVQAAKPGIKLDLRNDRHKVTVRSFPDQFQPFQDVFGCNVLECDNYQHTLFRLPLRGEAEATQERTTMLSDAIYQSEEKMQSLLDGLKESTSTLLLFTQNIERLSVHILNEGKSPNETEEVLSVYVKRKMQLDRSIGGPNTDLKTQRNLLTVAKRNILPVDGESSPQCPQTTTKDTESSMILEVHRKDTLARKKKPSKRKFVYCVSSCMSTETALQKASTKEGRRFGILPCGGVATLLRTGAEGLVPKESEGHAFSFLPLEIYTGLPVYINGTFLLQPNRRQLWSTTKASTDLSTEVFEVQWNICLMTDVICRALFNLLNDLKTSEDIDARSFQTLWPTFDAVHSDFRPIVQGFYDRLRESSSDVIYTGRRWISLQSVVFLDDVSDTHPVVEAVKTLINQHCHPSKIVAFLPLVHESIKQSGVLKDFQDNIYTWARFVETIFFPVLQEGGEEDDESDGESDNVIDADQRDMIIQHILDERIGSTKVTQFDAKLCATPCIPVTGNENPDIRQTLVKPGKLIHPDSVVGKLYHEGDMRFPSGAGYLKSDRLHSLTELGMATDTLDWEDICERAEVVHVEEGFAESPFQKSVVLLEIIDKKLKALHVASSEEDNMEDMCAPTADQISRLQQARFLPVMLKPEDYPLHWFGTIRQFAPANEILEAKFINLIGTVREVLDEKQLGSDVMTERLKIFLELNDTEPSVEDVVKQLQEIIQEECKAEIHSTVAKICGDIYEFLQKKLCILGEDNQILPDEKFRAQIQELQCANFLFTDGKFVSVIQLAFQFKDHCPPFLYSVPSTLTPYTNLLKLCGVRDKFQPDDFFGVVAKLHEINKGTPLSEDYVILAHKMIQNGIDTITETVKETSEEREESKDEITRSHEWLIQAVQPSSENTDSQILAVDQDGVIQKADSLTFHDMWWVEDATWNTTHPKLTLHNARVLGIQTARQRTLQDCSSSDGFEDSFGQTESLINRLQGILRDYHHVSDVMKELLQNADDAQATELHFVYDPRTHGTKKVVDEDKWGPMQRLPALCVYNNRPFTKEDIKGIQKVGVGGKGADKSTTGRFGIGFNAVYHLTDCPTFLSDDEKLCIFDPYVRHVPGATTKHPGTMYTCGDSFKEKFPDMLTGYHGDKFTLKGATMFRFPLRSRETVQMNTQHSSISGEWYNDSKIMELLEKFQEIAKDSMFFLKYIEHIKVSIIENDGKLRQMYSISSKITDTDRERRQDLSDHVNTYKDTIDQIPPMTKVYSITIEDTENLRETWMVAQTVGSDEPFKNQDDKQQQGLKPQLPRGGVAALLRSNQAIDDKTSRWKMKRRVYSFLPLPIESQLPVHVNGSFALDTSRRNLAKSTGFYAQGDGSETCLDHPWNRYLMEQVIATAYAHLIEEAKRILPENPSDISDKNVDEYYSVFPTGDYGDWNNLKTKTLQNIGTLEMKVLLVVCETEGEERSILWHDPNAQSSLAFFDNLHLRDYADTKDNKGIRSFLHSVNFKLVRAPMKLHQAFHDAGVKVECITADQLLTHLGNNAQEIAPQLPVCLKNSKYRTQDRFHAVTRYCLHGRKNSPDLHRVPLRLTNDNKVDYFSKQDVVYFSKFADLLPEKAESFIHKSIVALLEGEEDTQNLMNSGVVKTFSLAHLKHHLDQHFPEDWKDSPKHVQWTPGEAGQPTQNWLQRFWTFVFDCGESNPDIRWPIIPTTASTLVTPTKAKTVLSEESSQSYRIKQLLRDLLKCPMLSISSLGQQYRSKCEYKHISRRQNVSIPTSYGTFLNSTLASIENRNDVLSMFDYVLEERDLAGILNRYDSHALLCYFQEELHQLTWSKSTLMKLPIFRLSNGSLSSIHGFQNLHTCNTSMPMDEGVWMRHENCIFLEPDDHLKELYQLLNISPIDEEDIYRRYVVPNFNMLTQNAKEKHMSHIMKCTLRAYTAKQADERNSFLRILACLQWIPDATHGFLERPSFYYEPTIAVFQQMVEPHQMLPNRFATWREFLIELGFNHVVTEDLFWSYAKEIEKHASEVTLVSERDNLKRKAGVLLAELQHNEALRNRAFLQRVSSINFIPPVQIKAKLTNIFPTYKGRLDRTGQQAFTSFKEGVPYADMDLAWSVAKVLPAVAWVRSKDGKTELGTAQSTSQTYIIQHIQNVCFKMMKWNCCDVEDRVDAKTRGTLNSVMKVILQYLQNQHDQKTLPTTINLEGIPICLVDNNCVLVRADQIVFNMRKEDQLMLRPYLYNASEQIKNHRSFLQTIGAQTKPTFKQLVRVLASIKQECGENEMHPNEMKTAFTAVKLLFSSSSDTFNTDEILYLPSTTGRLKQSTSLCCADTSLKTNLPSPEKLGVDFVVDLKQCGIDDSREDTRILALLPEQLRPHNLSDSMTERPCNSNRDCIAGQNCRFLQTIRRFLVAEELQRALTRLLRHENEGARLTRDQSDGIKRLQEVNNLTCVADLKVELVDNNGKCLSEHPRERMVFMETFESDEHHLCLQHSELPVTDCLLYRELVRVILRICGLKMDSEHFSLLREVIACTELEKMNELLTKSDIPEYEDDKEIKSDPFAPGKPVPDRFVELLDVNPYNKFHKDEIVAYVLPMQLSDMAYGYDDMDTDEIPQKQEYQFAKVIREETGSGNNTSGMKRHYIIDVGHERPQKVSATSLYKFRRFKLPGDQTPYDAGNEENDEMEAQRPPRSGLPANSVEEAHHWITQAVEDAFTLPDDERRAALRRFRFMWHPDRNHGQEDLANAGFQFLQQEVERLENPSM